MRSAQREKLSRERPCGRRPGRPAHRVTSQTSARMATLILASPALMPVAPAGCPSWTAPLPNASLPLGGYERLPHDFISNVAMAGKDIGAYNHNAMLDVLKGSFCVYWKNCPLEEDCLGQRVLGSLSADGRTWSAPAIFFPNLTTGDAAATLEPA